MNVAFVIPSMLRGGAERAISILCNEFINGGHNVTLILTEKTERVCYPLNPDVNVVNISLEKGPFILRFLRQSQLFSRLLKEREIEIVISFITRTNLLSIITCKIAGVPIIISERNNPYIVPSSSIFRKVRDFFYRFADGVVFQTKYAKEYYCKSIQNKSTIIMNPISDITSYRVPFNSKINRIVTTCRLDPQKNVKMLIEAFSKIENRIPSFKLVIYGDGEQMDDLRNIVLNHGLDSRIVFMGQVSNALEEVSRSKIFVLSSNFEGLSNSVIEALCLGTACVVTDSPTYGNRDLINPGQNGYLTKVGDADDMAEKLLQIVENEDLCKQFSCEAQKLYNKVNSKMIYNSWLLFVNKVLS